MCTNKSIVFVKLRRTEKGTCVGLVYMGALDSIVHIKLGPPACMRVITVLVLEFFLERIWGF